MKNSLSVIGIQCNLYWEDKERNLDFFSAKLKEIDSQCDLVVLPEMFSTGFTMQPESVAEAMDGSTVQWMQGIAVNQNIALVGSIVISENEKYYNRLIFMFPSGQFEYYDKRHPFSMAGEDKVYEAGKEKKIINYKHWKICPMICYDLRFPVWARNSEDYDLLIYLANWPIQRIKAWETLLKARAIENMSFTIGVNRIGRDKNNYEYSGNSLIIDSLGNELSSLSAGESGFVSAILNPTEQEKTRKKLGFLNDRDQFTIH